MFPIESHGMPVLCQRTGKGGLDNLARMVIASNRSIRAAIIGLTAVLFTGCLSVGMTAGCHLASSTMTDNFCPYFSVSCGTHDGILGVLCSAGRQPVRRLWQAGARRLGHVYICSGPQLAPGLLLLRPLQAAHGGELCDGAVRPRSLPRRMLSARVWPALLRLR